MFMRFTSSFKVVDSRIEVKKKIGNLVDKGIKYVIPFLYGTARGGRVAAPVLTTNAESASLIEDNSTPDTPQ
jgi:hypothetical protein